MNRIYLRRRRKVYVKEGDAAQPLNLVAALQRNLECLGFACSDPLLARLQTLSTDRLAVFYKNLVEDLREMVGAHRPFKPMYPNFPQQVMEMSEAQLYLNAFIHYVTNRLPVFKKETRPGLDEQTPLRIIELGSKEDFESIFVRMMGAKTSLSPEDKKDLGWFVAQYRDEVSQFLPSSIPQKENLALLGALLWQQTSLAKTFLDGKIRTATDVLRVAVALSDGDVSLAEPVKFTKFKRRERNWLLSLLEQTADPTEDMLRWPERWKRLGERLHPGDYADKYPKTFAAFQVIRNDQPYSTFNRRIEQLLKERDVTGVLEMVAARPGDLTRRLDHLLRLSVDRGAVLAGFRTVVNRVSTPVLLQTLAHFQNRNRGHELRSFFPKGEVGKVFVTANRLPELPGEMVSAAVEVCENELLARFSRMPRLGKCYLDPQLADYLMPFSQRSASKALRTLVRGSRLPLPAGNTIRFFVWWKNGRSRTDIDLSAAFYDARLKFVDLVSYYNLTTYGGHHSGDIVDAPHGAAEFIDLDIERTKAANVRYVVMSLNSYTSQPYCDLPECFAGWMTRQNPNSGEIFEPRTVLDKIDIAANTRICLPAIFDLWERRIIWADVALRERRSWNNVHNNLSGVSAILRALLNLPKTNLHSLFSLHIRSRGEFVTEPAEATQIFSVTTGITPFDLNRIAAEFL